MEHHIKGGWIGVECIGMLTEEAISYLELLQKMHQFVSENNLTELDPVRCGCGGRASVLVGPDDVWEYHYRVKCWECGTQTVAKRTRAEAVEAWNKAMSQPAETKLTANVKDTGKKNLYKCGKCGQYFHRTAFSIPVAYCPDCGTKLDWSEVLDGEV